MKRLLLVLLASAATLPTAAQDLAIEAEVIHTMAGRTIRNGVIVVRNGKIDRVGPENETPVPARMPAVKAKVVTPGLIDAHTVVGLAGYLNQPHDQDQLERSSAMQPELRAIDSYNAREFLVGWLRGFGVTTIHTGHGPGTLVSGQTMIAKTRGDTVDEAVLVPSAMIAATLGESAFAEKGKSPGTRAKELALLRQALLDAQEYRTKLGSAAADKKPSRDLRKEAFASVLEGKTPLLVTVNRAQDIVSSLRLAKEFGIRIVLDGAADAHLVIDEIRAAGVPVIVHPTMARPYGEQENLSVETAALLKKAGIPVALQSGYEGYVPKTRVVLLEAAMAAANGLTFDDALALVTMDAAKILGVADRVGSIERGKDADFALFDGDPFEFSTHVTGVVIDGVVVSEEVR
ncbi:MAG: amidohydrolase family protein [Thermoanaerobaculia bacterium]|nr:amidohydrolase family protein [Thermoanaerobaculia bacterium]